MKNNEIVLNFVKANLGKDFNNNYNELGCAQSINNIFLACLGYEVGGGPSTAAMLKAVVVNPNFQEVSTSESRAGDIILSATGTGNGNLAHGHVGILGENGVIYSNDSSKDQFLANYTAERWKNYFTIKGGFPPRYFRAIGQPLKTTESPVEPENAPTTIVESKPVQSGNYANQDDNRPFWKSASKIVFLSFGISATFLVYMGKITPENWMILSSAVFGYYFKNQNSSK